MLYASYSCGVFLLPPTFPSLSSSLPFVFLYPPSLPSFCLPLFPFPPFSLSCALIFFFPLCFLSLSSSPKFFYLSCPLFFLFLLSPCFSLFLPLLAWSNLLIIWAPVNDESDLARTIKSITLIKYSQAF